MWLMRNESGWKGKYLEMVRQSNQKPDASLLGFQQCYGALSSSTDNRMWVSYGTSPTDLGMCWCQRLTKRIYNNNFIWRELKCVPTVIIKSGFNLLPRNSNFSITACLVCMQWLHVMHFSARASLLWNDLSENLRLTKSVTKSLLKTHFYCTAVLYIFSMLWLWECT